MSMQFEINSTFISIDYFLLENNFGFLCLFYHCKFI